MFRGIDELDVDSLAFAVDNDAAMPREINDRPLAGAQVHEVIVLDHSGPDLALILYAGAVKFALFATLVVGVLVPLGRLGPGLAGLVLLAGLTLIAGLVGVVEGTMARLRMDRVPQFLVAASALAGFGAILLLR